MGKPPSSSTLKSSATSEKLIRNSRSIMQGTVLVLCCLLAGAFAGNLLLGDGYYGGPGGYYGNYYGGRYGDKYGNKNFGGVFPFFGGRNYYGRYYGGPGYKGAGYAT